MITNADITLFNRKYNPETRLDEWHRTVIKKVSFFIDNKNTVGEKGLYSENVCKVRIPEEAEYFKEYISSLEYAQSDDVSNNWTIQKGDIVVHGICMEEIEKPADLTERNIAYCRINSFSDNRRGGLPHWRIGGA